MQTERVSIFIDGGNLYHNLKRYKIRISFEELIKRLETKREVTDVYAKVALQKTAHFSAQMNATLDIQKSTQTADFSPQKIQGLFDFYTAELDKDFDAEKYKEHHGFLENLRKIPTFHVVLCNLKKIVLKDGSVDYDIKGDDVHLASDLIKGAYENLYDVAIVVSGDEDFVPAIKIARARKKKVINAFFPKSSSYLLRNCCDGSINLKKALTKKRSPNTAKPQRDSY